MASRKEPQDGNYGTFEKDGQKIVAETIDAAVRLQFDGWKLASEPTVSVSE